MIQSDKDMQAIRRHLFEEMRDHLLLTKGIVEVKSPRIATYSDDSGGIRNLRIMLHGIDVGFVKSARFDDGHCSPSAPMSQN